MAKNAAFILPAGIDLSMDGTTLSLRHDGDVILEQTMGHAIGEIHVTGDLTLSIPNTSGSISAEGSVTINGDLQATSIHGRTVHLTGKSVQATAISATEKVVIGDAKIKVDVICAPQVEIAAGASGRVTVIECSGEANFPRIKGGFSVAEYDEIFGGGEKFLSDRGVSPLGTAAPATKAASKPKKKAQPKAKAAPPEPAPEPTPVMVDLDDVDDELEEIEVIEALAPDDASAPNGAAMESMMPKLTEALDRITSCYEGSELPSAIEDLQAMVENRDYNQLRSQITEVWNGLLGFHQKRGIRPHHQVTHAFNVIHGLIQDQA